MKKKHTYYVLRGANDKYFGGMPLTSSDVSFDRAAHFSKKESAKEVSQNLETYRYGFYKPVKVSCSLEE